MAQAGIMLIHDTWNAERQRGILKVNNKYANHAKAALALISQIDGEGAMARSLGLSGTLKKAKEKYIAM